MPDRLLVDLGGDGRASVLSWPDGGIPEEVSRGSLAWPIGHEELEDLRWYLEDYLLAPYGVWEDRGPAVREKLARWGEQVFGAVFGDAPARFAYERARDRELELVFRSADAGLLALPWELMRDGSGPVALRIGGISRSLSLRGTETLEVPGGRLRVLMVISRPDGTEDVGYQMVARPLLQRLDAVRGEVELTVLRPPTFDALAHVVQEAAEAGTPFHIVHFDGHGAVVGGGEMVRERQAVRTGTVEGVLAFERPDGGRDLVGASRFASVLAAGRVPVVVLNACQSGAVGKELEASVATALLQAGCAAVVAMAYSVYAVAAAEFMAAFYESLFAGQSVGQAVTAGRQMLFEHDERPSRKGDMPLADWLVPVHYMRRDVRFPDARTPRPGAAPPLDEALEQIRAASAEAATQDPLAAVDGVFVGRDDLFYQLETAARRQRVVVLTGPGGTGKTELAKGFARWWRDTGGVSDPRLVFWHSFEPGIASFGLDGVINEIGLGAFGTDFARLDPDERLGAVKQLLGQLRGLLVWDNFETVVEMPDPTGATPPLGDNGRAQLWEFLSWIRDHSSSTVIITSRAREDWLGEVRRVSVGGLDRAEAAEYAGLLLAPYPAARRRREERAFGELLEWLDGHPLAMRLTLPRLEVADAAKLLAKLLDTAPLFGAGTGDARLSSLGASITYSFAHLSVVGERLLPALSLFTGVADKDVLSVFSSVEGVPGRFAGASSEEWTAVLEDAGRVGLLSGIGAGMYRIHPALPGYLAAAWHTDAPDRYDRERELAEQALRTACAVFSQWLTGQIASGEAGLAYALIGWQRRTLGTMLGHALDHRAWDEADSIVRALDAYWETRGLSDEADAWADRIISEITSPGQGPVDSAASLWLYITGQRARRQQEAGHLDQAARAYQELLTWLQDQPPSDWTRRSTAVTYHQLGVIAGDRGQLGEAEDWYRRSLTIEEELADRPGMAVTYRQLGNSAYSRGQPDEAEDWYRRSLAIEEELADRPGMAVTYHQLGVIAQAQSRLSEAEEWYRRSLAIDEELGDRLGVATSYHQLGRMAQAQGHLDEAGEWYRRSLTIREEVGNPPGMATIYHQLGNLAALRGQRDDATDWYRKSLAIREELGDRRGASRTYHQLGVLTQDQVRLDEAEGWYHRSLAISEELGDRPAVAMSYHHLGVLAQDRDRLDEAEGWYRRSLAISEESGDRPSMALTMAQLGLLAEQRAQPQQALEWVVRCLALFHSIPDPQTGPGIAQLARLAHQLGEQAVDDTWEQTTGQPLPGAVREWVRSRA